MMLVESDSKWEGNMTDVTVMLHGVDDDELYNFEIVTSEGRTMAKGFYFSPEEAIDQVIIDLLQLRVGICDTLEVSGK